MMRDVRRINLTCGVTRGSIGEAVTGYCCHKGVPAAGFLQQGNVVGTTMLPHGKQTEATAARTHAMALKRQIFPQVSEPCGKRNVMTS
jgi:hypothetical protein